MTNEFKRPYLNTTDFTPEELKEFKDITLRKYHRKLTDEEARDQLARKIFSYELLHYFDIQMPIENCTQEVQNEQ